MRIVLLAAALLLAGCSGAPVTSHDGAAEVRSANLDFSFHAVNADACTQARPDMECRIYALWLTNTGTVDLALSDLGWTFNRTLDGGWTAGQCPYASNTLHDFAVGPSARKSVTLACLVPTGTVHDSAEVFYKLGGVDILDRVAIE